MAFVKLTDATKSINGEGVKVWVNSLLVRSLRPGREGTRVIFCDTGYFDAKESPDHIAALFNERR